ncbi:zinc transport system ATP-binding protein [Georgenia muralis]|uniref:Zinc transport system ATP-binding protein n=1 Tax=Georgenia muralis TaxID=154117 RepID=A0A3N4ZA24_9MICO|nr:zinc transport system ATP-binding protein [Georgenia muralis]
MRVTDGTGGTGLPRRLAGGAAGGPSEVPLAVEDLGVTLGHAHIVRGVTFAVGAGEMVALLGANGSGKSTLVKSLVGIVPVTQGHVRVFGADVGDRRAVPWRRVGYAPQRVTATAGVPATALEVVTSGLLDNRRLRPGPGARQRAMEALEEVGLAARAHRSVQVFSGGQQQRVLIARALVRRPDLLILDEPLAGIDRESKEALAGTLTGLRERGTTVLVVLHELGELQGLVQRAVVLRHGRVVHDGAPPAPVPGHDDPDHEHDHPHGDQPVPGYAAPDLSAEW